MDQLQQAYNLLWELIGRLSLTRADRETVEKSLRMLYTAALDKEDADFNSTNGVKDE